MARTHDQQNAVRWGAPLCALCAAFVACASYEGADALHPFGPAEDGGTDFGGASSGGAGGAGAGVSAPGAGAGGSLAGSSGSAGVGGTEPVVTGGSAGAGGSSTNSGGTGGVSNGGTSGSGAIGGAGGAGGAGGSIGTAGSAGTGGSGAVEQLLSQGKTASADSEQTTLGNLAALGNDGVGTTRWCAADGAGGHYWQVDLGQTYTLSKLQISWEKAAAYRFKVEGSPDGSAWSGLLDQTQATDSTANRTYPLPAAPTARWVRITTTTLPNTNTWASFFEFQVFGH